MITLDGKTLAQKIKAQVRREAETLPRRPGLAVVLVGEDAASRIYVNGKRRDCEACGFYSEEYTLPETTSQEDLLDLIGLLNGREDLDGVLVQLPLPGQMDEGVVLSAIAPEKDVDGFHPISAGALLQGRPGLIPCTPAGIMALLDEYGVDPAGKKAVVVGRSNIVGKPMGLLLLQRDATVTLCHSKTVGLAEICRQADILVTAANCPGLITADMVKEGAAVVDVSMNRLPDGTLRGDVDMEGVISKAGWLTPIPGGVGPMTRAMLMQNTLLAAKRRQGR